MTNNPTPATEKKWLAILQKTGAWLRKTICHNWGLKLTCLVLAICLWGGLISQNTTLPRLKTLDNVKITVTGESTLRQNGLIVVSGLEKLPAVQLKAQVPQNNYSVAAPSHYSVRLDLSQIKEAGTQTVKLTATPVSTALYGSVVSLSTQEVTIKVAQYATRNRIPVQISISGRAPEGYYASTPTLSPDLVEIGGPQELVEAVARCVVHYDMDSLALQEGKNLFSLPYTLQDHAGHIIDSQYITVSSQAVTLRDIVAEQTLYPTITVPVSTTGLITGQPMAGYEITGISVYPETVDLAAADIAPYLQEGMVMQPYNRLSVANASQDVVGTVSLRKPTGAAYLSTTDITVTITIRPIGQKDHQP